MHRIKYHQVTLLQRCFAQQLDTIPTKLSIRRIANGRVVSFQYDILGGWIDEGEVLACGDVFGDEEDVACVGGSLSK